METLQGSWLVALIGDDTPRVYHPVRVIEGLDASTYVTAPLNGGGWGLLVAMGETTGLVYPDVEAAIAHARAGNRRMLDSREKAQGPGSTAPSLRPGSFVDTTVFSPMADKTVSPCMPVTANELVSGLGQGPLELVSDMAKGKTGHDIDFADFGPWAARFAAAAARIVSLGHGLFIAGVGTDDGV